MVTEVCIPRPSPASASAPASVPRAVLAEFAVRQGDFAIVAAAVSVAIDGGLCREGRVVLGGVSALPVTITGASLGGQPASMETWRAMGEHAASQIDPPEDTHGSAGYRRRLAATLVRRALAEAAAQ
jgi:carbon-monoxide dehydrogenase medium subunit